MASDWKCILILIKTYKYKRLRGEAASLGGALYVGTARANAHLEKNMGVLKKKFKLSLAADVSTERQSACLFVVTVRCMPAGLMAPIY